MALIGKEEDGRKMGGARGQPPICRQTAIDEDDDLQLITNTPLDDSLSRYRQGEAEGEMFRRPSF